MFSFLRGRPSPTPIPIVGDALVNNLRAGSTVRNTITNESIAKYVKKLNTILTSLQQSKTIPQGEGLVRAIVETHVRFLLSCDGTRQLGATSELDSYSDSASSDQMMAILSDVPSNTKDIIMKNSLPGILDTYAQGNTSLPYAGTITQALGDLRMVMWSKYISSNNINPNGLDYDSWVDQQLDIAINNSAYLDGLIKSLSDAEKSEINALEQGSEEWTQWLKEKLKTRLITHKKTADIVSQELYSKGMLACNGVNKLKKAYPGIDLSDSSFVDTLMKAIIDRAKKQMIGLVLEQNG